MTQCGFGWHITVLAAHIGRLRLGLDIDPPSQFSTFVHLLFVRGHYLRMILANLPHGYIERTPSSMNTMLFSMSALDSREQVNATLRSKTLLTSA
jgi:hypothetical protein